MKKTFRASYVLVFCALGLTLPSLSQARPPIPHAKVAPAHRQQFDTTRFVPESELFHGQKGYALTVFGGTKIERFGIEILGVLSKINDGKDLILIKVTSGPSVSRHANIAAGMSGSPVYIGRRMVGAIAYSLAFAREPIGLVTPIGDMLEAWDPDLPAKPSLAMAATTADQIGAPPMLPAVTVGSGQLATYLGNAAGAGSAPPDATTTFEPVMTPVMVSGMSQAGVARLSSIFAPYHLLPMAGGGPPAKVTPAQEKAAELVPGAAVGVSLVQGDIDMTAIGTLTYRDGNRVIAFGHPFTGIGPIDAALTTASITDLFPSYMDSTKLGSPLETVGRIFQDRPFSVGGLIGNMPHMVPVSVTIHDESDNRTRYFHARVINHPLLTGPLISQVADQAILETHGTPGDAIALVTTDVDAEQIGHIVRKNIFYDPLSIDQSATGDLDSVMRLLSSNPFYPLAVKSVAMTVTIQSKHPTAEIDHIFLPKDKYAPGDTVNVGVVLKPYRRDPTLITVPLVIPSTAPDGSVTIQVRGGAEVDAGMFSLGSIIVIKPGAPAGPPAANIAQLVHQFLDEPKNNDIVASLDLPSTALDVQGEKLSLLPPSMSAIMRSEHSSGIKMEHDEVKKTVPMGWIVSGVQTLTITVAKKDVTDQSASSADTHAESDDSPAAPDASVAGDPPSSSDVASAGDDDGNGSGDSGDGNDDSGSSAGPSIPLVSAAAKLPSPDLSEPPAPPLSGAHPSEPATGAVVAGQAAAVQAPPAAGPQPTPTPVGRLASVWRQNTAGAFAEGTLQNMTISSQDDLRLCPPLAPIASSTAPYIWALAPGAHGDLFAGTGDDGVVYKVSGSTMTPYFRTGELEVSTLAFDPKTGDLYAGTSPHGAIYRITPDGKGQKVYTAQEKYVTALALAPQADMLYAATGGGTSKVYAIPLSMPSAGKVLFSSSEAHLLSLAIGPGGVVYAGGAPDGLVYAIQPGGASKIVYDAAEPSITALAADSSGVVYAGTSPHGVIYKIAPSASPEAPAVTKITPSQNAPVYGLSVDADGNVWACSSNTVMRIAPDATTLTYSASSDVSFISLAVAADGQIYAGTSDVGTVYALGNPQTGTSGRYTSPVHDALLPARWGTIAWEATSPPGTSITLQTRSGDVSRPDSTWSPWSPPYSVAQGQPIASPPARFIQYRAVISGDAKAQPSALPRLRSVAIYYLTRNQAPTVKFLAPAGGDALSGTATLRWDGSDPDKDTLTYSLFYSADAGKTWQPIGPQAPPAVPQAPATAKPGRVAVAIDTQGMDAPTDANVAKALAEFTAQVDQRSDIPPAVRARMIEQAPGVIREALALKGASPAASPGADAGPLSATSYRWDTKQVPDGTYQVKVIASNAPSNPVGALTAEAVSAPFVVDNTPPAISIDPTQTSVDPALHTVRLHGVATSGISFVEAVQYRIDGSPDWRAAAADSGLFDSTDAPFTINTLPLTAGGHTITVEAIDQASNTTTADTRVTVP